MSSQIMGGVAGGGGDGGEQSQTASTLKRPAYVSGRHCNVLELFPFIVNPGQQTTEQQLPWV